MANNEKVMVEMQVENNSEAKTESNPEETSKKPGHAVDPSINMSNPIIWTIPNDEERKYAAKFFNKDVKVRLARWCFIAFMPIFFLIILDVEERRHHTSVPYEPDDIVNLPFLIGLGVESMYVAYFTLVFILFWTGARKGKDRALFRVWTRTESVPGWASMNVAANQQLYPFEAIQSISEFSAIDGGVASFMLSNLGPFTYAVVTMHFASELHCNSCIFEWDIADICEIIGICGLIMIGIFELDPYNKPMKTFHYLGALLGCGTVAGYFIQGVSLMQANESDGGGKYLVGPILISVIAMVGFISWQFGFNKQTDRYQEEIRRKHKEDKNFPNEQQKKEIKQKITELSLKNVISEAIFLFCGATSLAIWLMQYHKSCKYGCAGDKNNTKCAISP